MASVVRKQATQGNNYRPTIGLGVLDNDCMTTRKNKGRNHAGGHGPAKHTRALGIRTHVCFHLILKNSIPNVGQLKGIPSTPLAGPTCSTCSYTTLVVFRIGESSEANYHPHNNIIESRTR